jgi:hypothetical protein
MKKFLALSLLMPSLAFGHLLTTSKWELIEQANDHRKQANDLLLQVQRTGRYHLKDLGKQEYFEDLIKSSIMSLSVKDPKAKLLVVGLSVLSVIAADCYGIYVRSTKDLTNASHHLEMENFYNRLSMSFKDDGAKQNEGTEHFLSAIDYVTLCEMFAATVQNDWGRKVLTDYIVNFRTLLIDQFNNPNGFLPESLMDAAYSFSETMPDMFEAIEDCDLNFEIFSELSFYSYVVCEEIECAYDYWGENLRTKAIRR